MIGPQDERAISAVLLAYAAGIDRRDWALFRACFTEDAVGEYPGFGRWAGAEAITEFMREAHEKLGPTLHRMTNFVIDGAGDGASAHSYVDVLLTGATPDQPVHNAAGWYQDRFRRDPEGWRIAHRHYTQVLFRSLGG